MTFLLILTWKMLFSIATDFSFFFNRSIEKNCSARVWDVKSAAKPRQRDHVVPEGGNLGHQGFHTLFPCIMGNRVDIVVQSDQLVLGDKVLRPFLLDVSHLEASLEAAVIRQHIDSAHGARWWAGTLLAWVQNSKA